MRKDAESLFCRNKLIYNPKLFFGHSWLSTQRPRPLALAPAGLTGNLRSDASRFQVTLAEVIG